MGPASCAVAFIGHFHPMDTLESLVKIETGMIAPDADWPVPSPWKARLCKRGWLTEQVVQESSPKPVIIN